MRTLILAPFERGLAHGGSQRATAMAERLEERGAEIVWRVAAERKTSRLSKLRAAATLRPALATVFDGVSEWPPGQLDAAIASHSYLAPRLESLPAGVMRIVDFHNLEWRHLADTASSESLVRRPYLRAQIQLMKRLERNAVKASDLSTFVSTDELEWARRAAPGAAVSLVPSALPRAVEAHALRLSDLPSYHGEPRLLYVGTLTFRPNLSALLSFLEHTWPAVRLASPRVQLSVAGDCADHDRARLDSFQGVEALGFVKDIAPLLQRSAAVVMPFDGSAGTSLRALYFALAGVWVIGSPAAFRGLPWSMGAAASAPQEWASRVAEALSGTSGSDENAEAAKMAALRLQRDPSPWDDLAARIQK